MNDDSHEARRMREQLDEELAGLSGRPEVLEGILSAAQDAESGDPTTTASGNRRRTANRVHARVPSWVLAAAAVAALAVAVPVVRSMTEARRPQPPGSTQPAPPTSRPAPTGRSGPSPSGSPPATTPSPSSGTARCDGPTLQVTVGSASGAAGTVYYSVIFRNTGNSPCYLRGFPGVAAADAAGTARVDAVRDHSTPSTQVVLTKGAVGYAALAVRNIPAGSQPCPAYPKLLVTPPDSRRTTMIKITVNVCASTMRITVVQPGAGP